jgi:PAS domain S-box-containing protein
LFFLVIFFILEKEIINRKKTESRADREVMIREKLINNSIDGIVSFDTNCNITLWNPGIASLTGISKSTAIGRNAFHVLPVLKDIGEEENFNETLKGNYLISKGKKLQFNSRNKILYYDAYYSPVFDAVKKVIGGLIIIRDNTQRKLISDALAKTKQEFEVKVLERTAALSYLNEELKKELSYRKISEQKINQSLHEKVIMLQEIHHRMKNNLQVISSLLNLQSNYIMNEDTLEVFRESQNRVKSMALIHEKLYKSGDVQTVEFNEYITSLCNDLFLSYNVNSSRVKLITDLSNVSLEINTAILCGLIVNELISNSLKHAFPGNRSGCIYISLNSSDNECTLVIKDDGDGFPPGIDFRNTESLGLQIVNILTEQLGGRIELNTGVYTEFKIMFHAAKTTVAAACV